MVTLSPTIIASFKYALHLLTGQKKRQYVAALAQCYFDSSPTKVERYLGVSRQLVAKALGEARTGITCEAAYCMRGRKKRS